MLDLNRQPIFAATRQLVRTCNDRWDWDTFSISVMDGAIDEALGISPAPRDVIQVGISSAQFAEAAAARRCTVAQIRAVWEVECSGSGWFTDVRGDILALDGPGGFIDGQHLPKILFEAHHFSRLTRGKYNRTHPNISSAAWNRRLYVGGVGEWQRLHNAMRLDEEAALKSASVGAPQIMGFNHALAGFPTVRGMWDAMKVSEANHLIAFSNFIKNSGLEEELRQIGNDERSCQPFSRGYNGPGYAANDYDGKIARAHQKWSAR